MRIDEYAQRLLDGHEDYEEWLMVMQYAYIIIENYDEYAALCEEQA